MLRRIMYIYNTRLGLVAPPSSTSSHWCQSLFTNRLPQSSASRAAFWAGDSRHVNKPSMLSRRWGPLEAFGMTATPRCTFQRSSTCGRGDENDGWALES